MTRSYGQVFSISLFGFLAVYNQIIQAQKCPFCKLGFHSTGEELGVSDSDLTFITNEKDQTLRSRFETLIKDTRLFDCLVGYFYASGFLSIYGPLKNAEQIRVLIGISTNRRTFDVMEGREHGVRTNLSCDFLTPRLKRNWKEKSRKSSKAPKIIRTSRKGLKGSSSG